MFTQIFRNWWMLAVRGAIGIVFGIAALIWPESTKLALVLLFGAFALADGAFAAVTGIASHGYFQRWWAILLEGLTGIVIGLQALLWPDATGLALLYFIAIWAIITGIFEVLAAIHFQQVIAGEWAIILNGLVSTLLGLLLFAFPSVGAVGLVWLIGIYAITAGIMELIFAFRLRNLLHISRTVIRINA